MNLDIWTLIDGYMFQSDLIVSIDILIETFWI